MPPYNVRKVWNPWLNLIPKKSGSVRQNAMLRNQVARKTEARNVGGPPAPAKRRFNGDFPPPSAPPFLCAQTSIKQLQAKSTFFVVRDDLIPEAMSPRRTLHRRPKLNDPAHANHCRKMEVATHRPPSYVRYEALPRSREGSRLQHSRIATEHGRHVGRADRG